MCTYFQGLSPFNLSQIAGGIFQFEPGHEAKRAKKQRYAFLLYIEGESEQAQVLGL